MARFYSCLVAVQCSLEMTVGIDGVTVYRYDFPVWRWTRVQYCLCLASVMRVEGSTVEEFSILYMLNGKCVLKIIKWNNIIFVYFCKQLFYECII